MTRRKPPKHLPKDWPEGHDLHGVMTPSEWIGLELEELWRRAGQDKMSAYVEGRRRNYREYFAKLEDGIDAELARYLKTSGGRGDFREYAQEFITKWVVRRGDAAGLARAHGYAWRMVRRDLLRDAGLPNNHLEKVDDAILDDLDGGDRVELLAVGKPQGAWPGIFEQVRAMVKERFGIDISDAKLRQCHAAFLREFSSK